MPDEVEVVEPPEFDKATAVAATMHAFATQHPEYVALSDEDKAAALDALVGLLVQ